MVDSEDQVKKLVEKIAIEQKYDNHIAIVQKCNTMGGNWTTLLYRVKLIAKTKPELKLFVKVVVFTRHIRETVFGNFFERELWFYTNVTRMFDTIQDQHNLRGHDRFLLPKFYGCNTNYLEETFVFEDISIHGFKTLTKLEVVDWECAAKVMEEVAKLHALSIAYGQEYPDIFKKCKNVPVFRDPWMDIMKQRVVNLTMGVVKEEHKDRLFKVLKERFLTPTHLPPAPRCPVMIHGDLKINNIMHRRLPDGSLEIQLIDYQMMRTDSPVADLMYMIFTSTDQKFRKKHYHQLLEHYYENLVKMLSKLGIDCGTIYPRQYFDEDLKTMLPYGLIAAVYSLPLFLAEESEIPEVDANLEVTAIFSHPCLEFSIRLNEVVDDFVEWGIV